MPKRKDDPAQKHDNDLESLPIPLQSFFWRQLSPFVRPYNRKLQETCCVSFEKVVVQNIVHGLSPSLTDAIQSIPRWRLVVASLPYVLHCCASSLEVRHVHAHHHHHHHHMSNHRPVSVSAASAADLGDELGSEGELPALLPLPPLGPNATKLLYTLHWILLDAAAECADQERERQCQLAASHNSPFLPPQTEPYLFPVTTLQVFVYLFAPLLPQLRPGDFSSFRLENGLKVWQPLWEFRQPDIACFTAPAKPTRSSTSQAPHEELPHNATDVGAIYLGTQPDVGFLLDEPERTVEEAQAVHEAKERLHSSGAPLVHMSDICTLTTLETPVTPQMELICEFCNTRVQPAEKDVFRCKCGHRRRRPVLPSLAQPQPPTVPLSLSPLNAPNPPTSFRSHNSPVDKEFLQNKLEMALSSQVVSRNRDISAATYFDVAVLRCLYVPPWSEEGMFWALRYFVHRLVEIRDYLQRTWGLKQRSNSVPSVTSKSRHPSPKHDPRSLSPVSRHTLKAELLAPAERRGSKRRRGPLAAMEDSPKFFVGDNPLGEMSPLPASTGRTAPQDSSFSFDIDVTNRSTGSPVSLRAHGSNPATPKEKSFRHKGKSFPRITITTENSPSRASVIEEGTGHSETDGANRSRSTLPRSKTDSNIAYPLPEYQEARGTANLIGEDGQLSYQALMRAVLVALNERPSQRICDVALSLLDALLDLLLEPAENERERTRGQAGEMEDAVSAVHCRSSSPPASQLRDVAAHRVLMSCITRIFIIIGCAYGCGRNGSSTGVAGRGQAGLGAVDFMRRQAQHLFYRLHSINEGEARRYLRSLFTRQDLRYLVDFCHAFFGSCVSPAAQDTSRLSKQTKKSLAWVAAQAAKPLVNQLIAKVDLLKKPENSELQNDLRLLLTYMKEAHEDIFRRIVLAGVMESQQRPAGGGLLSRPDTPVHPMSSISFGPRRPRLIRGSRLEGDEEGSTAGDPDQENVSAGEEGGAASGHSARTLRNIFASKRPKGLLKPLQSRESSETNLKVANSLRSPRVSISEDESYTAAQTSPRGKKKKHGASGLRQIWLKSPKSSAGSRDSGAGMHRSVSLVSAEGGSLAGDAVAHANRQQSMESTNLDRPSMKPRLSFKATSPLQGHINLGVLKGKRYQDSSSQEDDSPRSREIMGRASHSTYPYNTPTNLSSSKLVHLLNTQALMSGMKCLGTLLEFCPPGTVPEASVLAAMLDLSAPILSRACFFLECAQFVHRCNQNKWPEWMKLTHPQYRQSGPIGRLVSGPGPVGPRKQNILQRTAGKIFYEWARSLTLRLEDVMRSENVDLGTVVSPDNVVIEEEDYWIVGGDNPDGPGLGNCPFVLKMTACQLLREITAFLRETYKQLPKQKYGTMRGHAKSTAGDKRFGAGARRWSSVASTSGGTSHQSMQSFVEHGQVHLYQTVGHGPNERRISFMIADDTVSQRSGSSGADEDRKHPHLMKQGRERARAHMAEGPLGRRPSRIRKASQDTSDPRRQRTDSLRSRKASSVSERSDISRASSEEPATPHDDTREVFTPGGGPVEVETTEYSEKLPWLDTMIALTGRLSFVCDHKKNCTVFCFYRVMRSCSRLCWAVRRLNGDPLTQPFQHMKISQDEDEMMESQGQSGSQTPTTPSMSQRKLKLLRKASHYAGLGVSLGMGRSKATTLEKNESMESINKIRQESREKDHRNEGEADLNYAPGENLPESTAMAKYVRQHVVSLFAAPLTAIAKGLLVMEEKQLERLFPLCWELLLVDDEEVASVTAVLCVVCSVKISKFVQDFIRKEMNHEEAEERVDSVLKFQALWRYRHQIWIRLEDNAHQSLRVSPALNIDYTLPSPLIGRPTVDCPDAPWLPAASIKIEEVAISQEEQSKNSSTLVAATQTRRKQLQESMNKAIRAQEERNQRERERTQISMLPVLKMAAIEPVIHQVVDEREIELDEHGIPVETGLVATHSSTAQPVFPPSLGTALLQLIDLLDDVDVDKCGIAVCDLAFHTLWEGIVEDASLFMRYFLEKLSSREKQGLILRKLRKLMAYMPRLPAQAACTLFNHLLGYCMSYVRNPNENNFDGVEAVMSVLWHLVPSVEGISFKDIKAVLRREQCDAHLLLTANVPGAKKVIVHGTDLTSIPSQVPVNEETQFQEILAEALDFFSVPLHDRVNYILTDSKTARAHHPQGYVRDVYFFRRSYYPQLNLVHLPGREGFAKLQLQAYHTLFLEAQKVFLVQALFTSAQEKSDFASQQEQAMLLEDGLTKIPNFPRKALECDVRFQQGPLGLEYLGTDVIHKYSWVQMTSYLLTSLSRPNSEVQLSGADVQMLLSVVNGVLVLHCQDSATLRRCLATYITLARNLKHLFATTGFLLIMPTLLTVYAAHQSNSLLTDAIEFACSQFFLLHRNPFLLQMFGAAAGLLDLNATWEGETMTENKLQPLKPAHVKKILFSLDKMSRRPSRILAAPPKLYVNSTGGPYHPLDLLDVLEQVEAKKPLQPLDFCYQNDLTDYSAQSILTSAVSSCIAVIAFDSAESPRGTQMLQVLRTLLSDQVWHDDLPADRAKSAKDELAKIMTLAGSLKSLIFSCESLTRQFTLPVRSPTAAHHPDAGRSYVMASPSHVDVEANRPRITVSDMPDTDVYQSEFSAPRNHLLAIVAHFLTSANIRVRNLSKYLGELATRPPELLDAKSHVRLADIAHTLLKVAPYDKEVMACEGLHLYMTEILPNVDFSIESMKTALQNLLRRIEKTFTKLSKASSMRKEPDWHAAAKLIQGLSKTICNNNLMALMPQLRSITGTCIHLTLDETSSSDSDTILASPTAPGSISLHPSPTAVPAVFREATTDLCAIYLQAGREYCNLEQLCAQFQDRFLRLVVCFLLPFVLRVGSGSANLPPLRIEDLRYIVRALVQLLHPPVGPKQLASSKQLSVNAHITRTNSNMSNPPTHSMIGVNRHQELSRRVAFLGLKVVVACYDGRLGSEWLRLSKSIQDYAEKGNGGLAFWQFLQYTIVYRTALFLHLAPFALRIIESARREGEQEMSVQSAIREALSGDVPAERSHHLVIAQIALETNNLIDEYALLSHIHAPSRSPTQLAGEEGSQSESDGVHRLADFGRFRYGRPRKESVQQDRSSSSHGGGGGGGGGKRSPPIVIPVQIEKTEPKANSTSTPNQPQRQRSTLTRQKAQHGEHKHPPKKTNSSEIPEALEMVQLTRTPTGTGPREDKTANNVNSKVITVSVVPAARPPSLKAPPRTHSHSIDSLNDDEQISLLK